MMPRLRIVAVLILVSVSLAASSATACNVPLFRYALERWPSDRYRIVATFDGETNAQVRQTLVELERLRQLQLNVDLEIIDLSKLTDDQLWQVEGLESESDAPRLQVYFPVKDGRSRLCWSGDLTPAAVRTWRDSPLRRDVVADLTSGISAVWILVEGRDPQESDRLQAELQTALAKATDEISLPAGVIARQDASAYLREHPAASLDDVLRCDIPLRIEFSVHRLARDDERESALRAMVSPWNDDHQGDPDHAFVVPVFGRGRMIEPLDAERFSQASVVQACGNLVAECSCTVKALNPGVDLLLNANWQQFVGDSVLIVDRQLPTTPELVAIPRGTIGSTNLDAADIPTSRRVMVAVTLAAGSLLVVCVLRITARRTNGV